MRLLQLLFILLALPVMLTGCASTKQIKPYVGADGYVLVPGDTLRILVYGQEEMSGEFTIDPSGHISFPLVRDIQAAGSTVGQLEDEITAALQPTYLKDPRVSVQVLTYRDIYVLGEVRTPGKYPYIPNMTLLQAVAVAGGHTYRANEDSAEVTRLNGDILKTVTVHTTDMIEPGDTIIVKRRWF